MERTILDSRKTLDEMSGTKIVRYLSPRERLAVDSTCREFQPCL